MLACGCLLVVSRRPCVRKVSGRSAEPVLQPVLQKGASKTAQRHARPRALVQRAVEVRAQLVRAPMPLGSPASLAFGSKSSSDSSPTLAHQSPLNTYLKVLPQVLLLLP